MGPQESESTQPEYRLHVYLSSQTPVFGVRMQPITRVVRLINRELEVPPHKINLTWYREQSTSARDETKIRCCVHQDRLATYQCQSCVDLNLSVKRSYHCSSNCFKEAWKKHEAHHRYATENVNETLTENQQELRIIDDYVKWLEYIDGSSPDDGARIVDGEEKTWIKIGSSDSYTPKEHDIGLSLKLECEVVDCSMGTLLCPMYTGVTDPVIYPPAHPLRCRLKCLWGSLDPKELQVHSPDDVKFSVLSYNVLSDMYITGHLYCPPWARSWEYRGQLIVDEIVEYDPDILCLQEVQTGHFESFFKPELAKYGYSVAYKDKANKIMTYNGPAIDGCATFYRRDMFKEIVKYELQYENLARPLVGTLPPEKINEGASRLLKANVALVVILEIRENEGSSASNQPRICVANTHITASELVKDTKLFQVMTLINGLEKISESKIPIVICGDFNSTPPSPQYRFICKLPLDSVPREIDPLGIFQNCKLNHSMILASAYATFCRSDGVEEHQRRKMDSETKEPLFTTCTPNFTGTLDYIYFTVTSLRLESVLELLDREAVPAYLPSSLWPSDHIALMGSFAIPPSSYKYACSKIVPPNPWQQEAAVQ